MYLPRVVLSVLLAPIVLCNAAEQRPGPGKCAAPDVKALLRKASSFDSDRVTSFCSSYLHYAAPKTIKTTVTTTDYSYRYETVTKGTSSYTYTITLTQRENRKRAPPQPTEEAKLTADSKGRALGYAPEVVSQACSCSVTTPLPPVYSTKWVTKIVKTTVTYTSYRATTFIEKTATVSPPPPVCTGANPTFRLKLVDINPSRTDEYNNQYIASQSPPRYRGDGEGAAWITTPLLSNATLLTLECSTGSIRTVNEGWYANVEYFVALTPVYFDKELTIARREWMILECTPSNGELGCFAPHPGERRVMQTCPEYVQYYETPVAFGDRVYEDGPVCYGKRLVMVPA